MMQVINGETNAMVHGMVINCLIDGHGVNTKVDPLTHHRLHTTIREHTINKFGFWLIDEQWLLRNALPPQAQGKVVAKKTEVSSDDDEAPVDALTTGDNTLMAEIKAYFDNGIAMFIKNMDELEGWVINIEKDVATFIKLYNTNSYL